jgi:ferredoxin
VEIVTLTIHGHHIPRTGRNDEDKDKIPRPCGGVEICGTCKMEVKALYAKKYPEDLEEEG